MLAATPPQPVGQLLDVAQALMSATETDEVLSAVASVALDLFSAEACSLSLYDARTRELVFFLSEGQAAISPFRMSVDQGISGHVFRTGNPFRSNDVAADARFFPGVDARSGHHTRSMVCCPVARRGERLGTIQVINCTRPAGFGESDAQLLGILASMAGAAIDRTRADRAMRDSNALLRGETEDRHQLVLGESSAMHKPMETLRRAARSHASVLLLGESGVGKEVAARAVHRWSDRADKPLVVINCAALTPSLLESELFGHERGAFTGAMQRKRGKFEYADGGTLFLDEIGELAPELQSKLLRVLQEGEFTRVGGTETLHVDVRMLAATNRDLPTLVEQGAFRLDLYYRLNVVSVTLPPLRERREDLGPLAQHFLRRACIEQKRNVVGFDADALQRVLRYDWPGNVRELANVVERAVVLCGGSEITLDDLPAELQQQSLPTTSATPATLHDLIEVSDAPLAETVAAFKRQVIATTLERCDGNQARAAQRLGMHPSNLSRAIKQLGLR